MEYKGKYEEEENEEQKYFEYGAHFRYNDLVKVLKILQEEQNSKKDNNSNNSKIKNSINQDYNKVYNEINKQLCEKMTDIISPDKFIQSRNIQPLIQSLSQKLTDIVQSQSNQKPMKHNVTKKKCNNSNISNKKSVHNNLKKNIRFQKKNVNEVSRDSKQDNLGTKALNNNQKEIFPSRNINLKSKKIIRKNLKNAQLPGYKNNNIISNEIKNFTNVHENLPKPEKSINNNNNYINNNNESIYGSIIENHNNENESNNNNNKTVQNIIVKPNINISFINNYNTTFLNKSKKRQKKIRSRNNQELKNYSKLENKVFNFNNELQINDELNKINDNNNNKKKKQIEIILLKNNKDNFDFRQKNQSIASKAKIKTTSINNIPKSNNKQINHKMIKLNDNIINNFINKEKNTENNQGIKIIKRVGKNDCIKLYNNNIMFKSKINKTTYEMKHLNIINVKQNTINNKIIDTNTNQAKNFPSNLNKKNGDNEKQLKKTSFVQQMNEKKIKNRVLFTNKTILKKKIVIKK